MSDKYTPPPRLIWESVNGALDITTQLCKDLRAEIKELKDKNQLLSDTFNIQAELLRRSEYQVAEIKKEVVDLKAEINLIDPTGELRMEYI